MVTRINPHPCLRKIVDYYWIEKCGEQEIRVLPDGCANIILNVGKDTCISINDDDYEDLTDSILIGPQTNHYNIHLEGENNLFGIKFKQSGAFHFLKTSMSKYKNQIFKLNEVVNGESDDLLRTLLKTANIDEVKSALDYYLLINADTLLGVSGVVDFTIKRLLSDDNDVSITKLSREANVSNKHLISLFKKKVGISPKYLYRLNRFVKVVGIAQNQKIINWPQVAYECNFYDQAHLVNEFKHFSGVSPTRFLKLADTDDFTFRIL